MRHPPQTTSPWSLIGPVLEPEPVVLAHRLHAAAEIDAGASRPALSSSSASAGGSVRRSSSARRMFSRAAGWIRSRSGRISFRISPRVVAGVRGIDAEGEAAVPAERLRLLPPERQERADDAVLAPRP